MKSPETDFHLKDQIVTAPSERKGRFSITNKTIFLALFVLLSVLCFDIFISSFSVISYRVIYDVSFGLIVFSFGYTSIFLLTGKKFSWKRNNLSFSRFFFVIPIILNVYVISSIILLDVPQIVSLDENTLFQGLTGLFPLLIFILVIGVNATLFYINSCRSNEIRLHKLATYFLAIIAIETCVSIYGFHLVGVYGIRLSLALFHLIFIGLSLWSYKKFKTDTFNLRIKSSDILLILVSIGIFSLVYVPFGIYNLFGDNSVIVGNTLTITHRESLQPYYNADSYYSPIMGFISVLFASTTGLNNLLLVCNLPFLVGILLMPFMVYHFLKAFITDDSRIAVLGALIVCLMDGLAIVLLPVYFGNITRNVIDWTISSATSSLYATNICYLWLAPYKIFAATSAIAACTLLHKRQTINYVLAGALFFISFMNPRYSVLTIILIAFLFGIKKINLKGIGLFLLSLICFAGFTLPVHIYKQLRAVLSGLNYEGSLNNPLINQFAEASKFCSQENIIFTTIIVIIAFIGIILLTRLHYSQKTDNNLFTSYFSQRNLPTMTLRFSEKQKKLRISSITILSMGIIMGLLIYILLNAYAPNTPPLTLNNNPIAALNSIIMRYHILITFFVIGLLALKFPRRIALTILAVLLIFYFLGIMSNSINILPLIFTILAIPLISLCIKQKRKIITFSLLIFVFLGIFSSTFYSAITYTQTSTGYSDLSHLLNILIEKGEVGELVYSPSSYNYYVDRILKQAHMRLSSDSDCRLCLIDTNYIGNTSQTILNDPNYIRLFGGNRFVLLEKI